ncbi:hypothetical protein P153DRAFT_398225 [Dothidotthia symphoricarpi CBS 119687]|uniref:Zn(2)-C6 fungal-type domain-containing protein n=1 Tax=Dothidotthia symphoricarpi CBS 119687 TaxID=1392245 RepID=A0A6A6A9V7_9PLEO|nr:uncharacterized protein P153DRAFT_398225 [Dothidotthia symphoricarpi CBS 119687]KAF2127627.1 hypothetical protein P153DRAFT_398225 [Dothidotthia symphoricarpi CBS 119687]
MDHGDDMDTMLDGSASKRACDSCRTRKIRCDRALPCSNCKASNLSCTTTAPAQKVQKQRIHVSEEYEKKIDRIEDRLTGIEDLLESLALKLGNLDVRRDSTEHSSQSRSTRYGTARSPAAVVEPNTPAPFEGETAINSQSGYARELLAQAIGSTPSIGQNAEVQSALNALGELVTRQGQMTAPTTSRNQPLLNRSLANINPVDLERPPWGVVIMVLEKASVFPTMAFTVIFPFLQMRNLTEIFEDTYQNPGTCAAPRRIFAYSILYHMFVEYATLPLPGMDVQVFRKYSALCKTHMEVAMSQLDVFVPASYENIMALLLGAANAVEMCKPSLCWIMISSAAGLCQSLGYHRYQTMKDESEEERNPKMHVFWMIYMFDKTLSLRLGRASVIQDWDISLPFIVPTGKPHEAAGGDGMLTYWVKVARVQGQAYEKLFSPAAFGRSSEDRAQTAAELLHALGQAWFERGETPITDSSTYKSPPQPKTGTSAPNDTEIPSKSKRMVQQSSGASSQCDERAHASLGRIVDVLFYSDAVVYYSVCALIQRAVSSDNVTFHQQSLASSRSALVSHMRCNSQFNVQGSEELWSGYVHWSILQAPFTPFIVLFCNAIQNTDSSDLPSLSAFVASLESCRTISEGADKLYKMCHLFLQVAKLYVQAKLQDGLTRSQSVPETDHANFYTTSDGTQLDLSAMTQFDPYLSALGLVPNSAWPMAGFATNMESQDQNQDLGNDLTGMGFGPLGANQNSVQDWFSGSRYLMNLMEVGDDFQMPDLDFSL